MVVTLRVGVLGLSLASALVAETLAPRIESGVALPDLPPFQGKGLKLFNEGYPPPTHDFYYQGLATMGQVREWEENEGKAGMDWSVLWSKVYFACFATDGSLKETPPQFQTAEGLRFMRGGKDGAFQVQSAYDVVDVEKTKAGWKLTWWKAEDTMPATKPGWRVAIPDRPIHRTLELEEVSFDAKQMRREVIIRCIQHGLKPETTRIRSELTNKRAQSVLERFMGPEPLPGNLIFRNTLQRVRLPEERRYEQIRTVEKTDAKGNLAVSSQSSEIWEVDLQGRRSRVGKVRDLER